MDNDGTRGNLITALAVTALWLKIRERTVSKDNFKESFRAVSDFLRTSPAFAALMDKDRFLAAAQQDAYRLLETDAPDTAFFQKLEGYRKDWSEADSRLYAEMVSELVMRDGRVSAGEKECAAMLGSCIPGFAKYFCPADTGGVGTARPLLSNAAGKPEGRKGRLSLSPKKIVFCLAVLALAGGLFYAHSAGLQIFSFLQPQPAASDVQVQLMDTKKVHKLYTGFYYVPVTDYSYGRLKRDEVIGIVKDTPETLLGYCIKDYEVSVGYPDVMRFLTDDQLMAQVCSNRTDRVPGPSILSINSTDMEIRGKYRGRCETWDADPAARSRLIALEMKKDKTLGNVVEKSRKSLVSFLKAFCN